MNLQYTPGDLQNAVFIYKQVVFIYIQVVFRPGLTAYMYNIVYPMHILPHKYIYYTSNIWKAEINMINKYM